MNVLSLFDGMSCGQIALNRSGVSYDTYFSSEIDKYAVEVTQNNFPDTVQLGCVTQAKGESLPEIGLLMAGSPCQGFSSSGKILNLEDKRSRLFFEFVRLLDECKPKYWFLENVIMQKRAQDIITKTLGVEPVEIDSALVSAQSRRRLYWANFEISQPQDKGIILTDVLDNLDMPNPACIRGRRLNDKGVREDNNKNIPLVQCLEVKDGVKSTCLTTVSKDNVLTNLQVGRHPDVYGKKLPYRDFTLDELCRLQTVPVNYFDGAISQSKARKMLGNGWTVDVICHILSCMEQSKT